MKAPSQAAELAYSSLLQYSMCLPSATVSLWQRKRDERPARHRTWAGPSVTAKRRNHNVLFAVHLVGDRRRIAGVHHHRLPQQLAGVLVEGAEFLVIVRCPDEQQAAGGHDRPAVVLGAGVLEPLRGELGILAERDFPGVLTSVQVDRIQRPPRRRDRGVA